MNGTFLIHIGRCLPAVTLVIGIALAAEPVASADKAANRAAVKACVEKIPPKTNDWNYQVWKCCQDNGGIPSGGGDIPSCTFLPDTVSNPTNPQAPTKPGTDTAAVPVDDLYPVPNASKPGAPPPVVAPPARQG